MKNKFLPNICACLVNIKQTTNLNIFKFAWDYSSNIIWYDNIKRGCRRYNSKKVFCYAEYTVISQTNLIELASKIAEHFGSKSNREIYRNKKALINNKIDAADQEYIHIYA